MIKTIKKFIKPKERVKRHRLIIDKFFPEWHSRSGQPTHFGSKITGLSNHVKIHEISADYSGWMKIIEEVNAGKAKMTICYREIRNMEMCDTKIRSLSNLKMQIGQFLSPVSAGMKVEDKIIPIAVLAKNQGLSETDFLEWYKYYADKTVGIMHFTDFEY